MNYNFEQIRLLLGIALTVGGISSLLIAATVDFEKTDRDPFWGYWSRSFGIMDVPWLGGSRKRYFRLIGGFFTVLGLALLLAILFGGPAA